MSFDLDASELLDIVRYLDNAEHEAARKTYPIVKKHAEQLRDQWRENATETARRHGKHYPKAITTEQIPTAEEVLWEVGPESGLPQGGMGPGFEYGSRNQPPHWDGARAVIKQEPKFIKDLDEMVRELL
ncbi:hypothetical protein ACIBHX_02030 [Nonomuraea sp. NPDC050536]|uniref:hypothetical protein n=1 Tax=Nonomuraea sp. NPDC050536 TaxID=3364366 RepID=UPI0037C9D4C7